MEIEAKPTLISPANTTFDDPADSVDLVIRTADNVDFFVLSGLLSLQSPSSFFRHALQSSRHTEKRDGFPVLEVKEDSDTFQTILLLRYPYADPRINTIEKLVAVGVALQKYCMDYAIGRFEQVVTTSPLIKEQALRVFAVAVTNGWKVLGETAARNTLGRPLDGLESNVKELDGISARHLQRLLSYHKRCRESTQIE